MRIIVVAVGRLRPPFVDDVAHYAKLLGRYARLELIEVREDAGGGRADPRARLRVAARRRAAARSTRSPSASFLEQRRASGRDLCFVIGGPVRRPRARASRPPAVARLDHPPPSARPRRAARADLPRATRSSPASRTTTRSGRSGAPMAERHFARSPRLRDLAMADVTSLAAPLRSRSSAVRDRLLARSSTPRSPIGLAWALDKITTVGAPAHPERHVGGRVILAILELFGIGTLFYGLATVAEFFVSGQLSGLLEQRRIQKMIDSYTDHFIVCGYGRVGRQVARDLRASDAAGRRDRSEPRQPRDRPARRRRLHRGPGLPRRGAAARRDRACRTP